MPPGRNKGSIICRQSPIFSQVDARRKGLSMHSSRRACLTLVPLETRDAPAVATLAGTTLEVTGTPGSDYIDIGLDAPAQQYVVRDRGVEIGRFAAAPGPDIPVPAGAAHAMVK